MSKVSKRPALPPLWLLVTMMFTGQLAVTIFLPSLPSMETSLVTSEAAVKLTISAYLGAFALAQLVIGPLSDRFGRRLPVLVGMALFTVASFVCAIAPTVEVLIGARVVQAIGACTGIVLTRAIIRDTLGGASATRALAFMGMALGAGPALGPLIGGQIESWFDWRFSFFATAAMGSLVVAAALPTLKETLPPEERRMTGLRTLFVTYLRLLRMPVYMGYSLGTGVLSATFQAFLAGAPFLLISLKGVPPELLGFYTLPVPVAFIITNGLAGWMSRRFRRHTVIWLGYTCALSGTGSLLALSLLGLDTPNAILLPLFVYSAGAGFLLPNCLAGALEAVEPPVAGSASALGGFIQMGSSFVSTMVVAAIVLTSFTELAAVMVLFAILAFTSFCVLVLPRKSA
jgi:DHA1 family bicyclomycin/chloramphenicol resistance-like MFS transporter